MTQELGPKALITPSMNSGSVAGGSSITMRVTRHDPPAGRSNQTCAVLPTAGSPTIVAPATFTHRLPISHWLPFMTRISSAKKSVSTGPPCTTIRMPS